VKKKSVAKGRAEAVHGLRREFAVHLLALTIHANILDVVNPLVVPVPIQNPDVHTIFLMLRSVPAQGHECFVECYAKQPGRKTRGLLESVEPLINLHEYVLESVLGIFVVFEDPPRYFIDHSPIAPHEFGEGRLVAPSRQRN
jgi:hypothetical protein